MRKLCFTIACFLSCGLTLGLCDEGENGKDKADKANKPPKVLLQWLVGPEMEEEEDEEEDVLPTDRPDFTENSRNVGRGRIQLEAGYTYTRDRSGGVPFQSHSYPEVLVRMGLFADWLELRIGQNFGSQHNDINEFSATGAEDLYLGLGVGLTEQRGIWPESRIILQTRLHTGHRDLTAGKIMPGFNYLYGWDVIKDKVTFAGSSQVNRAVDDGKHHSVAVAQSLTTGISLTKDLGMYLEWFAIIPAGATDPGTGPEHYFDAGFTYRFTNNFQVDIRAGWGLNRHADDFFTGSGFAVRY